MPSAAGSASQAHHEDLAPRGDEAADDACESHRHGERPEARRQSSRQGGSEDRDPVGRRDPEQAQRHRRARHDEAGRPDGVGGPREQGHGEDRDLGDDRRQQGDLRAVGRLVLDAQARRAPVEGGRQDDAEHEGDHHGLRRDVRHEEDHGGEHGHGHEEPEALPLREQARHVGRATGGVRLGAELDDGGRDPGGEQGADELHEGGEQGEPAVVRGPEDACDDEVDPERDRDAHEGVDDRPGGSAHGPLLEVAGAHDLGLVPDAVLGGHRRRRWWR